jgi:GH18 family chitinase
MSDVCDYIVYMTYDLHGQVSERKFTFGLHPLIRVSPQWDANNQWSQIGCPSGNCLRTDVNITETMGALVMVRRSNR